MFDCREMFRHACAFCECADMAFEKFKHDTADISFYTTPSVVNSAFACEVFCKSLLLYFDIEQKKIHKLAELYDYLPDETKKYIKSYVVNHLGRWKNALGVECLDNISNTFAEWRYSYEHDWNNSGVMYLETGFLIAFRDALREVCCKLFFNKTWERYKSNN